MSLFSRKKSIEKQRNLGINSLKKSGKKLLIVTGCMLSLLMVAPVMNSEAVDNVLGVETAYASESTRSVVGGCTWENTEGTSWKAKQSDGTYLTNAWYQDTDGSWYLLKSDGYMAEQIFTDSDGSVYLLDWRHEGTYGKLLTSGTYAGVYIQTNDSHDGTWGRILNTEVISQLQQAISGGSGNSLPSQSNGSTKKTTTTSDGLKVGLENDYTSDPSCWGTESHTGSVESDKNFLENR